MSNNSIIEHRGNYHFVALREEFIIICQNCKYKKPDTPKSKNKASIHCKALILDILENWTNTKRDKRVSLAVYMTYKQWAEYMYGMYGRNVIIDSLDELIGEGLIAREPYKMFGKDTFQYFLNYRELNNRIKSLPEKAPEQLQPQIEKDPFTSKPVETATRLLVNATDLQVNPTRLLVNEDAFTSNHNVDTTQTQIIDSSQNAERNSIAAENQTNKAAINPPTPQKLLNEKKIDAFRDTFIALGREYFAYDKFTTGKPTGEVATNILRIIGDGEVSAQTMRIAFLKLWNHKDRDGTYWWRDKSKLTLKAYVNNYDDQEVSPNQDTTQQEITPTTSSVQRSTRRARKHQEQGTPNYLTQEEVSRMMSMSTEERYAFLEVKKEATILES